MRIGFLLFSLDGAGGTEHSVITQANALVGLGQDVTILSAVRQSETPSYQVDPDVRVEQLVDLRDPEAPRAADGSLDETLAGALHRTPSLLVPERWDAQFSALTDVLFERRLPELDVDVLVSVTPGLLALAVQLLPQRRAALVHQEHRSSSDRTAGLEPLLDFAPRADVVAALTTSTAEWLSSTLGQVAPTIVVMPNPLPNGFKPASTRQTKLIVAAGRLASEKQLARLVDAFGQVADQLPGWRLRILGDGPQRVELTRMIRRHGLWDRVELPGQSADMPAEWAVASISALPSRSEGLPLVAQEAMAAGVPVVAFDTPSGNRAVITHEQNGLLVGPDAPEALAAALLRLATDDDLRHRLGEGARESSRRFEARTVARHWLDIYTEAVSRQADEPHRVLRRLTEMARARPPAVATPTTPAGLTPADARRLALSWTVRCAERVSQTWFAIPARDGAPPRVVLPMRDRAAYLAELGGPEAPDQLSLVDTAGHGWPERRAPLGELAADLAPQRTGRVSVEPWPMQDDQRPGLLSGGCRVDVEFWETGPDGSLLAAGSNLYVDSLPAGFATVESEIEGVRARTLPLMTEPTVLDCTFPVDAVYTWVDGDDPAWNAARAARLAQAGAAALSRRSSGRARFVSRDELRYSMRSLHLFAPWLRTIHLVTAGQVPSWLAEHPRIHLVDHREILPADALPTFNSHAIESSLHKIPGLAEHFVYFNDDVLLARPQDPQRFFTAAGQTAVFLSANSIGTEDALDPPPWIQAAWNNRRLLRETFGVVNIHSLAHAPHAHRRSVLEEVERRFPDEVARTARSPFRSSEDISLLSSFAQHYGLMTGTAVIGAADGTYVDIGSSDVIRRLRRLQSRERDFICLGDHHDHALNPPALRHALESFLDSYLPVPAPWERSD